MNTARQIIDTLKLEPLPREGGYYRRIYTHNRGIDTSDASNSSGKRALASAIYFLLTPDTFSALHRLPSDELFHFHMGSPVSMLQLHPGGGSDRILLGPDLANGQRTMTLAPGGSWQGARILDTTPEAYTLLGVSVHPGFDWTDFELGERAALLQNYPDRAEEIKRLTR
ncbi:MAG: cupin domain-containing protein [Opitutales bacterium]